MKIVVCVKQAAVVPRYVEFAPDGSDVDPAFITRELNEPDTYALEEAFRMRDAGQASEVVALTAGGDFADEALRQALARGADRAVRVSATAAALHDPITVARSLASAIRAEKADLVLCGVQSNDASQQSTGPALASALELPCVAVATRLELTNDNQTLIVQREFEGGAREIVDVDLPAVVTVQIGLNAPRYGSFKGMMRAKKTPIVAVEATGIRPGRSRVRRMTAPEAAGKRAVKFVEGGAAAVAARILDLVKEARK